MSKKKNSLPEQLMLKLINEVKKRPCLWNPDHDDYNDKYHVMQAWLTISEELNMPEKYLRTKWKNLRDMYRKVSKKAPTNRRPWRFYSKLKFLVFKNDTDQENGVENDTFEVEFEEDNTSEAEIAETFVKFEPQEFTDDTIVEEEDPIPDNKRKRRDDDDYDIMFLKSLAPYFKQLDPIRKLVVRSRMQDMLLNEIAAQNAKSNMKS